MFKVSAPIIAVLFFRQQSFVGISNRNPFTDVKKIQSNDTQGHVIMKLELMSDGRRFQVSK